jgi:hypothetical protein
LPVFTVRFLHLGVVDGCLLRLELRFRALDGGAIGLDGRRGRFRRRAGLFRHVLGHDALAVQRGLTFGRELRIFGVGAVARELRFGLIEQRLIAREVGLRLYQGRLEWALVNREEELTLLHEVAFVKVRGLELSGDLRADGDGRVGLDVADCGEVDGDVALRDFCRDDRNGAEVAASAAAASPGAAG